ncbi:MAG: deoxyribodipyrimidine photolyase [Herminiimonas sp.]|nr:deoxyribodipyrimidine photolyase [Herminiimonas sp.]
MIIVGRAVAGLVLAPMKTFDKVLVWFRRDLRNFDHAALHAALSQGRQVYCAFIFDKTILDPLLAGPNPADRRVEFILASVTELHHALVEQGGGLIVRHAHAEDGIPALAAELGVDAVFVNRDYEPAAIARDEEVARALEQDGRQMASFKDQVIFEKEEVRSMAGKPLTVFTPYRNAWLLKLMGPNRLDGAPDPEVLQCFTGDQDTSALAPLPSAAPAIPTLSDLGFVPSNLSTLPIPTGMDGGQELLDDFLSRMADYDTARNFPGIKGPSYLSVHLRFGTVSIRAVVQRVIDAMRSGEGGSGAAVWLGELIWRDFYFMILDHFPRVVDGAFKPEYDRIEWETGAEADAAFQAWCEGRTGFPLVDAAMAQINETGYMHNRLRMVTASFLIKDLGIDWRRGERYFAAKLNDYDLSANNGGWQWAASSGCDAQPFFRIFNPVTQSERFDAEGKFIRRYLPQLARLSDGDIHAPWTATPERLAKAGVVLGRDYPQPLVQHDEARKRTLERYAVVKKSFG